VGAYGGRGQSSLRLATAEASHAAPCSELVYGKTVVVHLIQQGQARPAPGRGPTVASQGQRSVDIAAVAVAAEGGGAALQSS
jgi:hypothetical protein